MKRLVLVIVALVVIVGLLWVGTWFYLAYQVRSLVASLADTDGVSDPKITCTALDVRGFPLALEAVCDGARLVQGDFTADLTQLRARYSILHPSRIDANATSPLLLADAFTGSEIILHSFLKNNPKFKIVGKPFSSEPFGIGVRKGNAELLDVINATLKDAWKSGEYQKLYKRWFGFAPTSPVGSNE